MAKVIDSFSPRRRATVHPYNEWLCGEIMLLELNRDFTQSPQSVATSIRSYARRRGIPVVVRPTRDFGIHGAPFRFIEVWGDPNRALSEGLPPEIEAML